MCVCVCVYLFVWIKVISKGMGHLDYKHREEYHQYFITLNIFDFPSVIFSVLHKNTVFLIIIISYIYIFFFLGHGPIFHSFEGRVIPKAKVSKFWGPKLYILHNTTQASK